MQLGLTISRCLVEIGPKICPPPTLNNSVTLLSELILWLIYGHALYQVLYLYMALSVSKACNENDVPVLTPTPNFTENRPLFLCFTLYFMKNVRNRTFVHKL